MANKARHAFGSEVNVDSALEAGTLDAYDILFLDEHKIGWIDKNGQKVILDDAEQVAVLATLPETGKEGVLYIIVDTTVPTDISTSGFIWNGTEFVPVFSNSADNSVNIVEF